MGDPCLGAMAKLGQVVWGVQRLRSEQGIRQKQRKPMTVEGLEVLRSSWSRVPGGVDAKMLWAAATLSFFGFMRSGEQYLVDRVQPQGASCGGGHKKKEREVKRKRRARGTYIYVCVISHVNYYFIISSLLCQFVCVFILVMSRMSGGSCFQYCIRACVAKMDI